MTLQPGHAICLSLIDESESPLEATVESVSGSALRLRADRPMQPGAAVRLDLEEAMYLGEVCYCAAQGRGFAIGVEVQHSLLHLPSLDRLVKRLCGEDPEGGQESESARRGDVRGVPNRKQGTD